jgi:hypothetical protein
LRTSSCGGEAAFVGIKQRLQKSRGEVPVKGGEEDFEKGEKSKREIAGGKRGKGEARRLSERGKVV